MNKLERLIATVALAIVMIACAKQADRSTPSGAAAEICDDLVAGRYEAVLDRTYEWSPQNEGGEFNIALWAEQNAARQLRGMMLSQMQAAFEQVEGYEVSEVRYANDSLSARVVVHFIRSDKSRMEHHFTMLKGDDGLWQSMAMHR